MTSIGGCPTCGNTNFLTEAQKLLLQSSLEEQVATLPLEEHEEMLTAGKELLSFIDHEWCGHSVSDDTNHTSYCAFVTNGVFHMYFVEATLFASGKNSNVFVARDAFDPEERQPPLVLKESKGLCDGINTKDAVEAYEDVLIDYQRLVHFQICPKYTESLKEHVVAAPLALIHGQYIVNDTRYNKISHLAPVYEELFSMLETQPFSLMDRVALCSGIIDCVAAFHENDFVLCDLKPENLYFVNGLIKFGDSGSIQSRGDPKGSTHTPAYLFKKDYRDLMEMVDLLSKSNEAEITARLEAKFQMQKSMDVLAVAITCYTIFTGMYPFNDNKGTGCNPPKNLEIQIATLTSARTAFYLPLFAEMTDADREKRPTIEKVKAQFSKLVFQIAPATPIVLSS
jgi:hypothetical protein